MKCDVCLELLEEYLDVELASGDREEISAHLITCATCADSFSALTAEQEIFSRYDRELDVPPFLWTRIAQHTVAAKDPVKLGWRARLRSLFATPSIVGMAALLLIAIAIAAVYFKKSEPKQARVNEPATPVKQDQNTNTQIQQEQKKPELFASSPRVRRKVRPATRATIDQSDVLSSDLGYLDSDDRDTAKHIEQTQNLLRSIRNVQVSDGDEEIDVTYDKALSRRLLNENVVLRRDAEMKAKFPTKSLLADVEPLLIDIANLPDHARPEDVRVIKERVQKTEIVAALMGYQERGTNNR